MPGSSDWKKSREYAEYTSASLITKGLHSWKYGRFEMRGRIDTRDGLWPAFWTLGTARPWPANGKIDIMEYYRGILLAIFEALKLQISTGSTTVRLSRVNADLVILRPRTGSRPTAWKRVLRILL